MKNFTMQNLWEENGVGKEGQPIRKISLYLIDDKEDPVICDCCDENKQCAHLSMLDGTIAVICKDCLQLMVDAFEDKKRRRKII